ncbi:hypothetical protein ACWIGI_37775 [Nocardia sp. NPDC055321]
MTTTSTARTQRRRRAGDTARAKTRGFIGELVAAGIRPTQHFHGASPPRRASIAVVGWSVGGCRGLVRGCGPGCELVVTTNANLVVMCQQPERRRFTRAHPRYVDLASFPDLGRVLALGRSTLLPRPLAG